MKTLYRDMRLHQGLSQAALASRAGVGQPTLANIEAGRRDPSAKLRARLDALVAYGEPGGSAEPAYLLAAGPRWVADYHAADDKERVAVFQFRRFADHAAGLLGLLPLDITVVPVWPSFIRALQGQGFEFLVFDGGVTPPEAVQCIGELITAFGRAAAALAEPPTFVPGRVPAPDDTTTTAETAEVTV